jgi:hypothetical protein
MPKKLALKRLTASDLSLFSSYFRQHNNVKQKAINMDARVFVGELYPSLPEEVDTLPNHRVPLDLYLFGPGLQDAHNLQRKILKQEKNWRLNGELVNGPEDSPDRYAELQPGDFAVFEFSGTTIPTSAKVVLVSQNNAEDQSLHQALQQAYPEGSMFALQGEELDAVIAQAQPENGHPILELSDKSLSEDIALGDALSAGDLIRRRAGRGISPEDFKNAKASADRTGTLGEELLNHHFMQQAANNSIASFEWTSHTNSISPFDFTVTLADGSSSVLDAKSTSGDFDRRIHLSFNEIATAVEGNSPYDIYRLSNVTESSATLRIAKNVGPSLHTILERCNSFPENVRVDSISLEPSFFVFEPEVTLIQFTESEQDNEEGGE